MPPKKAPKSAGDGKDADPVRQKLDEAQREIVLLQRELLLQKEATQRAREQLDQQRARADHLDDMLQARESDGADLIANMERQFRATTVGAAQENKGLEERVATLQRHLDEARARNTSETERLVKTLDDKNAQIADYSQKLSFLSTEFEGLLNESFIRAMQRCEAVADRWTQDQARDRQSKEALRKKLDDFFLARLGLYDHDVSL